MMRASRFFARRCPSGRPSSVALAFLLSAMLAGCMGGTGTDTENGLEPFQLQAFVVEPNGSPAPGVLLSVHRPSDRPDSAATSPLLSPEDSILSDDNGAFLLTLRERGVYILQGRRDDTTVLLDTLKALPRDPSGPGPLFPMTFRIQGARQARGSIMLLSGYRAESGKVFIRGTSHLSAIGTDASYDLGSLPSSAEQLSVSVMHHSVPAGYRYIRIAATETGYVALSSNGTACVEDPDAPAHAYLPTSPNGKTLDAYAPSLAGAACSGKPGTLVNVRLTDSSGTLLKSLGNYIIPLSSSLVGGATALPESCLVPGTDATPNGMLNLASGNILVTDLRRGPGCLD